MESSCPDHLCRKTCFVVEAAGDSMEPTLHQGSLAGFATHRHPRQDNQIVIARVPQFGITGDTATTHRIPGCRGTKPA
jgi:phage repressor protein C with HTH and peptisase S24 domain